jgi:hypothetical protein
LVRVHVRWCECTCRSSDSDADDEEWDLVDRPHDDATFDMHDASTSAGDERRWWCSQLCRSRALLYPVAVLTFYFMVRWLMGYELLDVPLQR